MCVVQLNFDDRFPHTKTNPKLYWLPLTEAEIQAKQNAQQPNQEIAAGTGKEAIADGLLIQQKQSLAGGRDKISHSGH